MLETLTRDDFAPLLNDNFVIALGNGQDAVIELIEVGEQRPSPKVDNYALLFRGPGEYCLLQNTYKLQHKAFGNLVLFLVTVGETPEGFRYEAVVNRLRT